MFGERLHDLPRPVRGEGDFWPLVVQIKSLYTFPHLVFETFMQLPLKLSCNNLYRKSSPHFQKKFFFFLYINLCKVLMVVLTDDGRKNKIDKMFPMLV